MFYDFYYLKNSKLTYRLTLCFETEQGAMRYADALGLVYKVSDMRD